MISHLNTLTLTVTDRLTWQCKNTKILNRLLTLWRPRSYRNVWVVLGVRRAYNIEIQWRDEMT